MRSELVVDVTPRDMTTALLEDGRLVSLQRETRDASYAVGNLYLAKVKKLMPGLNAAFVNVGHSKDAFLHYLDLGSQFNTFSQYIQTVRANANKRPTSISKVKNQPDTNKHGTINDVLTQGQELLVQIAKEPISTKGPRLTTEITFTGRYLVLTPFHDRISVSQKIKDHAEKTRLRRLIESMKPKNFGVIVRTSAENKRAAELNSELKMLIKAWDDAIAKVQQVTPPSLVYEEESRAVGEIRDILNPDFESIQVNNAEVYEQIHDYVTQIAPDRSDIVKLYSDDMPIFDKFGITKQIKSSFGKTVSFKSGAYIIVESTEALHVIDVNSGNRSRTSTDQESNALNVNLLAADEIARQLRLRDMGGIIVVDFIDMNLAEDRQLLYERMCENMKKDRARHNILPLSKFGLMQITRQRVRPAMDVAVEESCPTCHGTGKIKSSILFTDQLESKIDRLVNKIGIKRFSLHVHPYVAAYINQGVVSLKRRWQLKYGLGIRIVPSQKMAFLQYEFYDQKRQFIDMQEENEVSK